MDARRHVVAALFATIVILFAGFLGWRYQNRLPRQIVLSLPLYEAAGTARIALEQRYFEAEGLDVVLREHKESGAALEDLMKGKAQAAIVGEKPLVELAFQNTDFRIIATIHYSDRLMKVVGSRTRGVMSPKDLLHRRVGVERGTMAEYYLHGLLAHEGVDPSSVKVNDHPASELIHRFKRGELDAVALREPDLFHMVRDLGHDAVVFERGGLCHATMNLVMRPSQLASNPDLAPRLLRALARAEADMTERPNWAVETIATWLQMEREYVANIVRNNGFELSLSRQLPASMGDKARWLRQEGYAPASNALPDFHRLLAPESLRLVKPSSVRLGPD